MNNFESIVHRPDMMVPVKPKGLGDRVKQVAQPVAAAVDAVLGTNLKECDRCEERKEKLNELGRKVAAKLRKKKK